MQKSDYFIKPLIGEEEDNLFKIPVGYKAHEDTKHIYTKWRK